MKRKKMDEWTAASIEMLAQQQVEMKIPELSEQAAALERLAQQQVASKSMMSTPAASTPETPLVIPTLKITPVPDEPEPEPEPAEEGKREEELVLKVKRMHEDAVVPTRGSVGSVGYDLYALDDYSINPGGKNQIRTGISVQIPSGYYGRIAPRSSLAWINFIDVGAGVIDPDYRGEVKVILYNFSAVTFKVGKGMRIAQMILERVATPPIVEVPNEKELERTERGFGGFGSTGV
jgi:dUTP pyrophosphatase